LENEGVQECRKQPYPLEFRQKIVDLVRSGRGVKELAEEFEPSEQTIRNWLAQADPILGNARIS
jgi:transposase-like protein